MKKALIIVGSLIAVLFVLFLLIAIPQYSKAVNTISGLSKEEAISLLDKISDMEKAEDGNGSFFVYEALKNRGYQACNFAPQETVGGSGYNTKCDYNATMHKVDTQIVIVLTNDQNMKNKLGTLAKKTNLYLFQPHIYVIGIGWMNAIELYAFDKRNGAIERIVM